MAVSSMIAVLLPVVCMAVVSEDNPVIVGQTVIAGEINPLPGSTGWALTSHGIAEKLFTVNSAGELVGQVAQSTTKIDDFTWDVTLKPNYKFSDGTVVTPTHIVDCLTELNTENGAATSSVGTMTVTAIDANTVRIVSTKSTPTMMSVLAEWVFTVYLKKDDGSFIFTGPYAVETFEDDVKIDLMPNTYYSQANERPSLTIKKYADGDALATDLEAGTLDVAFHLPIDTLSALRQVSDLTIKSFEVSYHYMMFHNLRKSPLSDIKVRQAVDKAIDRTALQQVLAGGIGTRSLFPDNTPWFLDLGGAVSEKAAAEALLAEAGWILDTDGKRMKDGNPLTIKLVAYPQRPGLPIMQPLIKANLEAVGITVNDVVTDGSSWDGLDEILGANDFDLLMYAQNVLPAGDPAPYLNGQFRSTGSSNWMPGETISGLDSETVDGLLDELALASETSDRYAAAAAAHQAILDEVPVSNLVTPEWHVGLSSRMAAYEPYGSDYYIIHENLFVAPTPAPTAALTPSPPTEQDASGASHVCLSGFFLAILAHM
jgi:peptide/nickel transport system substrate-binding protein